ncbi:MAG: BrnA antitoxin family protein [Parvibaculaceae bacterium]
MLITTDEPKRLANLAEHWQIGRWKEAFRMTRKKTFSPGKGYTRKDWDEVSNNPKWTKSSIEASVPFSDTLPHLASAIKRSRGRPALQSPRQQISIRLDPDVIEKFKATGPKWQSRINDVLKRAKV